MTQKAFQNAKTAHIYAAGGKEVAGNSAKSLHHKSSSHSDSNNLTLDLLEAYKAHM